MNRYKMLIDGEWVDAEGGETFESDNPFLGAAWALVPRAKAPDVDRAVTAARRAFRAPSWKGISASARGLLLRRLAELIAGEADRLAEIETRDNGKLITEMRTQLRYIPQWFHYFGGLADKIEGRVIPIDKPGMVNFTREEPLGVVAAITPWNSPLMLATWKLAPALAAGNTIVWKPSEFSSVSALEFGRLFAEAGFPPGVVNIVTGFGSEIGEPLVSHPHVAKIAFTGGDRTGQSVYELAARTIKPVTLELGGKSANIVFKDALLDNAVKGVVSGIFAATGQTCIAGSRALIHRSIHDEFVDRLVALGKTARMGDPLLDTTQVGPITTRPQYAKVLDYIDIAKKEGAECVLGGGPATRPECGAGWFIEPTVFAGVKPTMRIAQEEVFGPVLSVIAFDEIEEAFEFAGYVAEIAAELRAPLLHLSTDYVFDGALDRPYREDDATAPTGVNGRSKLFGERRIASIHPDHVILRTSWIYSPFGANFVKTMLRVGETRAEVGVVADQRGNPTYALDIADALFAIARRLRADPSPELRGIFHLTGNGEASWAEFAEAIFAEATALGRAPVAVKPIATAEYPTPARRPANSRLDNSKLASTYGVSLPRWRDSTRSCVARLIATRGGEAT